MKLKSLFINKKCMFIYKLKPIKSLTIRVYLLNTNLIIEYNKTFFDMLKRIIIIKFSYKVKDFSSDYFK